MDETSHKHVDGCIAEAWFQCTAPANSMTGLGSHFTPVVLTVRPCDRAGECTWCVDAPGQADARRHWEVNNTSWPCPQSRQLRPTQCKAGAPLLDLGCE